MKTTDRVPAKRDVVGILGEKASCSGDSPYIERDDRVTESRRTCSSTDSGRSSISSSQTSHCDLEHVEKGISPKNCEKLQSVEKSRGSTNLGDVSGETNLVEDLDVYADVTLIPKTTGTIIAHPKESKSHSKRSSRAKGNKTSKAKKSTTNSKSNEGKIHSNRESVSRKESNKLNAKGKKDDATKPHVVEAAPSSTTDETKEGRELCSTEIRRRGQPDSSTVSKDHGGNETGQVSTTSGNPLNLDRTAEISGSDPEEIDHRQRKFSGSSAENEIERFPDDTFSSTPSFYSFEEVKGPRKPGQCISPFDDRTLQPVNTGPDSSSTLTLNASPKHSSRPVPHEAQSQQTADLEKSEVKTSYSTSSSPLPIANHKLRNVMPNKRRPRTSGSPVSAGNSSIGKAHFVQRPVKAMPIRPLLPLELQHNLVLGNGTSRKQWVDRNRRTVQNTSLLPNPLFHNGNCLCLQQLDNHGVLMNQPLYWFLPSIHYAPTSEIGMRNTGTENKSAQTDGTSLIPTPWQSGRFAVANACGVSATEAGGSKLRNPNENGGIRWADVRTSNGKSLQASRITLTNKGSRSDLAGVPAQTEQILATPNDSDLSNQNDRKGDGIDGNQSEVVPQDLKINFNPERPSGTNVYLPPTVVNSTKLRHLATMEDVGRPECISSLPMSTCGSETSDISRSFFPGVALSDGNPGGQILPSLITYNGVSEPCVIPPNFLYLYSADGQLFAIPSSPVMYPTQVPLSNGEIGSVSDSVYSSPAAILSAQALSDANLQTPFTVNNFSIPNTFLTTGQELTLEPGAALTTQYEQISNSQLPVSGHVPPSCPPEVNQWPACNLPMDGEHAPELSMSPQQQTSLRPLFISSQNASTLMQNAYALNSPYMSGSVLPNQQRRSIISSVERTERDPGAVQTVNTLRATQYSQTSKPKESTQPPKPTYDVPSGLLGSAKHNGSILGDSKSLVLHPISTFMDDLAHTGPNSQAGHARQKKHSSKTNLYIRGLPSTFTEEQLHTLAPDKELIRSVKLITGSEGEIYGFIDFTSNVAARAALLHIKSVNRELYVNFAYESEKDPHNVYITNIPETWTASNVEDLKKIFQPYGQIATAIVMTKRSNNFCTGAGFVRFVHTEDAQRAIEGIRTAQIKLEGGKGPLEVKLADRQKPAEDQTSTKSRTWKSLSDGVPQGSDVSSESQIESVRSTGISGSKKAGGCLLATESVSPLLGIAMNTTNRRVRSTSAVPGGQGLLPNAANFSLLNRLNNPASFALAFQNALSNTPLISSSLLLQNPLNAVNIPMAFSTESQTSTPTTGSAFRAQAHQISNLLSQARGPRMSTGLLQNPPLPPSQLYHNQPGLIPLIRSPMDEMTYNAPAIGVPGAHPQSAVLGHALQPNGTWTASTLIPGMFASM